jgi:hypothetical protein
VSPWRIDVAASVSGWSCPSLVPSAACSGGQTGVASVAETLAAWKRRVLYSPVGVEEGVVAAVVEAETEILEREPERRLTDEAPGGVRGGRQVAGRAGRPAP